MSQWNFTREELAAQSIYWRLMLKGAISLSSVLLTSAGELGKVRVSKAEDEHYVRPPRGYELPEYQVGMEFSRANEKYLRPTRYCNCSAPQIVAMAHALGAYQLPNGEFVQNAFEFVKEQVLLEILPIDGVERTLARGTGTCFHLISLFIALCRSAGIPARYKMFSISMIQAWRDVMVDQDPLVKKWYDAAGYFLIEGEGEVWLDGRWVVGHVGPTAERQAAAGLPVTHLGEDAIGVWFYARPGTVMRMEAIPRGLGPASRLLQRIAPGSMERVNIAVTKQTEAGRQVIAVAGGRQAYDAQARASLGPKLPSVDYRARKEIVFEGR